MGGRWVLWFVALVVAGMVGIGLARTGVPDALRGPFLDVLAPVQGGVRGAIGELGAIAGAVRSVGALAEENRQLRQKVSELERELLRLQEAGAENRQLRSLLDFVRENPGREYLPATVIAHDPNNLVRSVVVDRGAEHGIQPGAVVVTERGLLGKVTQVTPNAAKVLLVTDASSVVNGVTQRGRVQGVVSGRPNGFLAMHYVQKDADIRTGDQVLSSGLGGGFPRGLLLGTVERVRNNDQEPFQEVRLSAAVRPGVLEAVLIVRDFTPLRLP